MDVNRLHAVIARPSGRRCGRTFAMLVEAIQQADFGSESVTILACSQAHALTLVDQAQRIANEMGYQTKRERRDVLRIDNMRLRVASRSQSLLGQHDPVFEDHYWPVD